MTAAAPAPLVLDSGRAESVASLSIAGIDSRYYLRRLDAVAAAVEEQNDEDTSSVASSPVATSTIQLEGDKNSIQDEKDLKDPSFHSFIKEETNDGDDDEACEFEMGDHVFKWCSYAGIPFCYQHHAIVLEVFREDDTPDAPQRLRIADFSNWRPDSSKNPVSSSGPIFSSSSGSNDPNETFEGCIRTYETDAEDWKKVEYSAGFWKRYLSWSGTCTQMPTDPPGMVRARVQFLVDNPSLIPCYNTIQSNCECVALWCKTGTWSTLQAASWLGTAAAGQVKSAATLAGAVTATQVSVTAPAAGVWGWMGLTTTSQVSLAAAQPILLPAIAAYGVITVGVPAVSLALAHKRWNEMTTKLNDAFWAAAVAQPDLFVECITHWSTQHDASPPKVK